MPLRHAHATIAAMLSLAVVAFWPRYFSVLPTASPVFHFHGITATLWLVVLALQSWTIQTGRRPLHRMVGMASLVLFPVFLAGNVAIILGMARITATDPLYRIYGARLGTIDLMTPFVLGWLWFNTLAQRRNVQRHARYVMATPLLTIMPILSRLLGVVVPALHIDGPQDFHLFGWAMRISQAVAVAAAAALYSTAPRYGRPFLVTGVVLAAQTLFFDTLGTTGWWQAEFAHLALLPLRDSVIAGGLAGALLSWGGWVAGSRRRTDAIRHPA